MKKLDDIVTKLESKIPYHELMAPDISRASVGWHIRHCLLVLNTIIDALEKSNPADYKSTFDIRRMVLLLLQKIPRGKIKAPRAVQPTADYDVNTLQQQISLSKEKLKTLKHLNAGHYFTHPFLGDFKLKQAVTFIRVHTNHHLKIISDIFRSSR